MNKNATWRIDEPNAELDKVLEKIGFPKKTVDKTLVGRTINLIHEDDFDSIADGTELISIFGERKIKGTDYIDTDTRGGYLAYGTVVA